MKTLSNLGEWGFLRQILPPLSRFKRNRFLLPVGDDAAILKDKNRTVLSIDGLSDGTHFRLSWQKKVENLGFSFGQAVGWKLLTSALSDLAAMGDVRGRWAMVFLGGPGSLKDSFLLDIHRGVLKAAKTYDCALAGGDTVRSKTLTLAAAVGGQLKGRYLARSTASSGDLLCVAGHVGDASAGLNALENRSKNMSRADQRALVRSFFYHQPMFSASKMLAAASSVTSLIDLSDSLFDSLEILCRDSHAGADVEIENIPVSREYARLGEKDKRLLEGGEDYSLLFTVKPSALLKLSKKLKFSVIGVVQPRAHGIKIHQRGRRLSSIAPFRHF